MQREKGDGVTAALRGSIEGDKLTVARRPSTPIFCQRKFSAGDRLVVLRYPSQGGETEEEVERDARQWNRDGLRDMIMPGGQSPGCPAASSMTRCSVFRGSAPYHPRCPLRTGQEASAYALVCSLPDDDDDAVVPVVCIGARVCLRSRLARRVQGRAPGASSDTVISLLERVREILSVPPRYQGGRGDEVRGVKFANPVPASTATLEPYA
ncbi:hypothetical protein KM043_010227 [Ampulex compressa]|nr:hypothetical protein KM043_010227 [Ampulex compressa]